MHISIVITSPLLVAFVVVFNLPLCVSSIRSLRRDPQWLQPVRGAALLAVSVSALAYFLATLILGALGQLDPVCELKPHSRHAND